MRDYWFNSSLFVQAVFGFVPLCVLQPLFVVFRETPNLLRFDGVAEYYSLVRLSFYDS